MKSIKEYKFSLAHLTLLDCPPPQLIYIAAVAGYDYVSLRPVKRGLPGEPDYTLAVNRQMLRETKQAIAETGIGVHDIEVFRIADDVDVSEYKGGLEVGAELGAKSIITSIWTDNKNRYMEQFGKLADMAAEYNINVDLEFVTWAPIWNLQGAKEVLEAQSARNIGVLIDMIHFYRSRVNPSELAGLPQEWFHFIHLCDSPQEIPDRNDTDALIFNTREQRKYVGDGAINFKDILNRIPPVVCSIELPHLEYVRQVGHAEHAKRCLSTAKDYLKNRLI